MQPDNFKQGAASSRRFGLLEKASRCVNTGVEIAIASLGIAMVLVVAAQVFARYVLNHSLFWSEELARYLLVWLTMLGASVAYRRHLHPGIDIITVRLPSAAAGWVKIFTHLVAIGFFGVLIYHGTAFTHFIRFQISPALNLPKWTIYAIMPLSGVILALHAIAHLSEELKGFLRGR